MKRLTMAFCLAVAMSLVWAEPDRTAQFEQRMAQTQERLQLSDEQIDQITPILESSMKTRRTILAKYGIDLDNPDRSNKLGMRTARKMQKEMATVNSRTLAQLDDVLNAEQLAEYKAIQAERKSEMRAAIRGSR